MKKTKIINTILAFVLLCGLTFANGVYVEATSGQNAFNGPFTYVGETTFTYRYLKDNPQWQTTSTYNAKVPIDDSKTVTITENQILSYWIHTPINYEKTKKYPVVVYCPGSGCTIFDHEDYSTVVDFSGFSVDTVYGQIKDNYLQNVAYGKCGYGNNNSGNGGEQYINIDGSVNCIDRDLGNYDGGNAAFVELWYDLVYNQKKYEYDCFFIYIEPGDEVWWENKQNINLLNIHTMYHAEELEGMSVDGGGDWGCYGSSYIASEVSANIYSQLLVQLIDKLSSEYSIDLSRQYLSGFSLGAQFSYDTICHYPDRFAAACITGLPSADLTEANARNLVDMNIWLTGGSGDINPKFSSNFANLVTTQKELLNGRGITKYTSVSGAGHTGTCLSKVEIIDFMFNSKRSDTDQLSNKNDKVSAEGLKVTAKVSPTLDNDTYDMVLISGVPLGNFDEHGFIITTGEDKTHTYEKTKTVAVKGMVKSTKITLSDKKITLNATDYNSAFIYVYIISDIPKTVMSFDVKAYAKATSGLYYGDTAHISVSVSEQNVSVWVK